MPRRSTVLTLVALAAFAALLLYTTLASQRFECTVAVAYNGKSGHAAASAASTDDAERQARTAACGPIAKGMNESIACTNTPPVSRECRTL
ncbi:MAG TPA: hypothetical protein VFW66_09155 [Gemmatimonadales bacterium]|nr:hypothetical protein [Gemmatimonadales bacterium]